MMTDLYNQQTAKHYSAYRPPLHKIILQRILSANDSFSNGIDIGCGTGASTTALVKYCTHVMGIDPSQAMLDHADEHPDIKYLRGSGEDLPLADSLVDIVTWAGSLFYMDVNRCASEIQRVCRDRALIIPYDFVVLLDDVLASFGIKQKETNTKYNPRINFSGIDFFEEILSKQDQINLRFSPYELAHVLLSEPYHFQVFSDKYSNFRPFEKLIHEISESGDQITVQADIFYSKYQIVKRIDFKTIVS